MHEVKPYPPCVISKALGLQQLLNAPSLLYSALPPSCSEGPQHLVSDLMIAATKLFV